MTCEQMLAKARTAAEAGDTAVAVFWEQRAGGASAAESFAAARN